MLEASSPKARQDGSRLSGIVLILSLFGALIVLAQIQQMSRGSAPEAQISIQAE
jgi:hypothetical protein